MAREDFFLEFGSNAPEFADRLSRSLEPARQEIARFAQDVEAFDRALEQQTGGQGISGMLRGLSQANTLLETLNASLVDIDARFSDVAHSMRVASQAVQEMAAARPPAGAPAPTSHAGRTEPAATAPPPSEAPAPSSGQAQRQAEQTARTAQEIAEEWIAVKEQLDEAREALERVQNEGQVEGGPTHATATGWVEDLERESRDLRQEFARVSGEGASSLDAMVREMQGGAEEAARTTQGAQQRANQAQQQSRRATQDVARDTQQTTDELIATLRETPERISQISREQAEAVVQNLGIEASSGIRQRPSLNALRRAITQSLSGSEADIVESVQESKEAQSEAVEEALQEETQQTAEAAQSALEDMSWREVRSEAGRLGVFQVGMNRAEAEQAIRERMRGTTEQVADAVDSATQEVQEVAQTALSDLPWRELVSRGSEMGVFQVGISRPELEAAIRERVETIEGQVTQTPVDDGAVATTTDQVASGAEQVADVAETLAEGQERIREAMERAAQASDALEEMPFLELSDQQREMLRANRQAGGRNVLGVRGQAATRDTMVEELGPTMEGLGDLHQALTASPTLRRMLGETGPIQPMPESFGGEQAQIGAVTEGQMPQVEAALEAQQQTALENMHIYRERLQEAASAATALVQAFPEATVQELESHLQGAEGVTEDAATTIMRAIEILDEIAAHDLEGEGGEASSLSRERVQGALGRMDERFERRQYAVEVASQGRGRTGETDLLEGRQLEGRQRRDLEDSLQEALFGARVTQGRRGGGDVSRPFDMDLLTREIGGLPARTPEQSDAFDAAAESYQEIIGRLQEGADVPTREEIEQGLAQADTASDRLMWEDVLEARNILDQEVREEFERFQQLYEEAAQLIAAGSERPVSFEGQERIDAAAERGRAEDRRRSARERRGLTPIPRRRELREPEPGALRAALGGTEERERIKAQIAEAEQAQQEAGAPIEEATQRLQEQRQVVNQLQQEREELEARGDDVSSEEWDDFNARLSEAESLQRQVREELEALSQASEHASAHVFELYDQLRESGSEAIRTFERLNELINAAEAGEVNLDEISPERREEMGFEPDQELDVDLLRRRRMSIMRQEAQGFAGLEDDLWDPSASPDQIFERFDEQARAFQGQLAESGQTIEEWNASLRAQQQEQERQEVGDQPGDAGFQASEEQLDSFNRTVERAEQIIAGTFGPDMSEAGRASQTGRVRNELLRAAGRTTEADDPKLARQVPVDRRLIEEAQAGMQGRSVDEVEFAQQQLRAAEMQRQDPSGFAQCCERIIAALDRIRETLRSGVRISGRGGSRRGGGGESRETTEGAAQAEERLTAARQEGSEASLRLSDEQRMAQRAELPEEARSLLGEEGPEGLMPEEALTRATDLVQILRQQRYQRQEAIKIASEQLELDDNQKTALDARLRSIRAKAELEERSNREASDRNRITQEGTSLNEEQLAVLGRMSQETRELVERARELNQALARGEDAPGVEDANAAAVAAMEDEFGTLSGPAGSTFAPAGERHRAMRDLLGIGGQDFSAIESRRFMGEFGDKLGEAARVEGPRVQDTWSDAFFGQSGFMSRMMRSTGTFLVRNLSSGMVFGMTRMFRQLIREAIQTEAQFIRVSDALEATGRSAAGVRTELMSISTDLGRPLEEVYEIASNITGAFEDVRDVEFGTRIVAQLELISQGALQAKDGFDALQTIASAFELEGSRELERIQDTAVAIQNVMAIGIDDTIQGIGGMAGQAAELNFELEETAVLVAAVAKGTNQSGRAAAEQFGRILSTFETQQGRNALLDAGIGEMGMFEDGEVGSVAIEMIEHWDRLTEAQQRNIKATFGSRREQRAFLALINRREQIMSTLIETENAHGLGQQRVEEVMQELAHQIEIAGANFTNFGAVLVRSGVLDFFGLMLRGFNNVMGTVNEFLSVLNDLADNNPLASFARTSTMLLLGLATSMKAVGLAADMMAASMARQAAQQGTLQAAMAMPVLGGRISRAAGQQGVAVEQTGRAGRMGLMGGLAAGLGGRSRRARRQERQRFRQNRAGQWIDEGGRFAARSDLASAGVIDPLTGLAFASGFSGLRQRAASRASRPLVDRAASVRDRSAEFRERQQERAERRQRRSARLLRGARHRGVMGGVGRGMAMRGAGMGVGSVAARGVGTGAAAVSGLTGAIAALGPKAWIAAAAIAALSSAVAGIISAGSHIRDRRDAAGDILAPMMSDAGREAREERERERDMAWFRRWTQSGREAREQEAEERHEELQELDPGERRIAELADDHGFWNRFRDMFVHGQDPFESFDDRVNAIYEEEMERFLNEMEVPVDNIEFDFTDEEIADMVRDSFVHGTDLPVEMPESISLSDLLEDLDGTIDVDDDGRMELADDHRFEGLDRSEALEQIGREREIATEAFAREADALDAMEDDMDEDEFLAATAALQDLRNRLMDKLDREERAVQGLRDVDKLLDDQLDSFVSAMDTLEGVSPSMMHHIPELEGTFESLFDDIVPEDSSWEDLLDGFLDSTLSDFERAEMFQEARRAALAEAERLLADAEAKGDEERVEALEQHVSTLATQVIEGQRELWELATGRATEMADLAAEVGGSVVRIAEEALTDALAAINEQLDNPDLDDAERARLESERRDIMAMQVEAPFQRRRRLLERSEARGASSLDVSQEELDIARDQLRDAQRDARERGLTGADRAAFLHEFEMEVWQREQAVADDISQRAQAESQFFSMLTEDPRIQAQIELQAALEARERYEGSDPEILMRLEQDIIQARRDQRDAIESLAQAELQLALAETQDPREQAMLRLRDATRARAAFVGDDPAARAQLDAAILESEQEMLQQLRAERDARAQTQILMQRDPERQLLMEMQLARVQLAEAAEEGAAAYENARQNLIRLEQALEDQRQQTRLMSFDVRLAATDDPIRQAALQVERANLELRQATGAQDRMAAHQSILAARRAEVEAVMSVAESQLDLARAVAEADGNQVRAAQLQLEAARAQLRQAKQQGMGDAAIAQARSAVIQAEAQIRDAVLQDHLDTVEFNREMGVITQGEAIQSIQAIMQEMDLTRDQRRQLTRQIHGLQDDLRNQLTGSGFNIPTEIDLPTAYMVRRSLGIDELRTDRLPDEWRDLTHARVEIDDDLTEPLSDFTDAVGTTNDEVVSLARNGAEEAIAAIMQEYQTLGPRMDDALAVLAQAQETAWREAEDAGTSGATRTSELSLDIIKELPPAIRSELERLAEDQQAAWGAAEDAADTGTQRVTDLIRNRMREGVTDVGEIVMGFAVGLADGLNPILSALGEQEIKVPDRSGGGLMIPMAEGGFLPDTARIEQPHGQNGLVQWAEYSTHGEAFIPLSPANRPRSVKIWEETGRRLGVDSFADGGIGGGGNVNLDPPSMGKRFDTNERLQSFARGGLRSPNYDRTHGGTVYYGGWTTNLAPQVIADVVRVLNNTPGGQGISNAYRSPSHNRRVGGVPDSDHMHGHAVDLIPLGPQLDQAINQFSRLPSVRWVSPKGTYRSHRHVSWERTGFRPDHESPIQWDGDASGFDSAGMLFDIPDIPDTPEGLLGDVGRAAMEFMREAAMNFVFENFGFGLGLGPTGEIPSGDLQDMVQQRMLAAGWGMEEWPALANLIQRESSWNPNAQNPNSSAFGLFQFLDDTWAGTGIPKTRDPGLQTEAGLRYIRSRYGSPSAALQHWLARVPIDGQDMGHWYRTGGIFDEEAIIGVGEAGPEAVIPLNSDGVRFMSQLIDESVSQSGFEAAGRPSDMDARSLVQEVVQAMSGMQLGGDTNVTFDNVFNQAVQSPAQVQQVARAVVDLLHKQMGEGTRTRSATPRLIGGL